MSEYMVLAPVTIIATLAAVVGLWAKWTDHGEMTVSFDISNTDGKRLQGEANRLGVKPADLAQAALVDLLSRPDEDFQKALQRVRSAASGRPAR